MADDELLLVPSVPDALREAARLGTLIPFIGAGISRLAGCPTWAQFADGAFTCFTGRIWMLIVAHAAFDLTALAMIYWNLESKIAHLVFK
jgi:hypothetical protein